MGWAIGNMLGNLLNNFKSEIVTDATQTISIGAAHIGRVLITTNALAVAVTCPATAAVGTTVTIVQRAAGQLTFASTGSGSVVNRQSQFKTAAINAMVTLVVTENSGGSAAVWVLAGDTAA